MAQVVVALSSKPQYHKRHFVAMTIMHYFCIINYRLASLITKKALLAFLGIFIVTM
jgi:hypothetical protein